MDISPYLDLVPAPIVAQRRSAADPDRARFFVRDSTGEPWSAVTWGAFGADIRAMANFLADEGLVVGDCAAIFAPNRVEWLVAAFAIQSARGVMVPVYGSSTADQAAYVVEHSASKVLFADSAPILERVLSHEKLFESVDRIVILDDTLEPSVIADGLRDRSQPAPSPEALEAKVISWSSALGRGRRSETSFDDRFDAISVDDNAIMLYTSGTSGPPKGVPLTYRNLTCNQVGWLEACAACLEEDAVDLLWLPMSHIFGYGEACIGNLLGFKSYLSNPAVVLEDLPEVAPQVFFSVPAYWEKLARAADTHEDLRRNTGGSLRFCLSGGAGLKVEVKEKFLEAGVLILEGYGLTETSPTLTLNQPDDYRFDTVGKPLCNVRIKLADDGEILAKGPNVFSGYHNNPDATSEAFDDEGWFHTGDVGRFTDDGFLQIVDRKKDILVTAGGKNIPPANVEIRFKDDPVIEHLVVFGDGQKYLVAGVWLVDGASGSDVQKRIDRVNAELPRHQTIKKFVIFSEPLSVASGFLTPTLKLKRKRVYEAFGPRLEALYT